MLALGRQMRGAAPIDLAAQCGADPVEAGRAHGVPVAVHDVLDESESTTSIASTGRCSMALSLSARA
ncbi:hypothetical protein [Paractinoplanes atraurantiacus]|uniref:hypothetical protein n=1 Tax=Paractinoplanes atraurantiacus TaxID=1036182 RepID=UPI000BE3F4A1|nr:hypothetical protein [Actinoplanes atraurantiacus]